VNMEPTPRHPPAAADDDRFVLTAVRARMRSSPRRRAGPASADRCALLQAPLPPTCVRVPGPQSASRTAVAARCSPMRSTISRTTSRHWCVRHIGGGTGLAPSAVLGLIEYRCMAAAAIGACLHWRIVLRRCMAHDTCGRCIAMLLVSDGRAALSSACVVHGACMHAGPGCPFGVGRDAPS
jgi:hypothetical protein